MLNTKKEIIAYLAGLIMADGHISKKDSRILIYTKDEKNKEIIYNLLAILTKNRICVKFKKGVFEICVYDKKLSHLLFKKYKIPKGKKSHKIILPKVSKEEKIAIIAGFFDGDGSIYVRKVKKGNKVKEYTEIKFKSKSILFLQQCIGFLEKMGLKPSNVKTYNSITPYFIISRQKDIEKFLKIFKPILKKRSFHPKG